MKGLLLQCGLSNHAALLSGAILVMPSLYFIVSSLLSMVNVTPPYQVIGPLFENSKQLGLNINLLILLGPLAAILINLPQVLHASFKIDGLYYHVHLQLKKLSWSWMVIAAGLFCLASLFLYLSGENCNC